MKLYRISNIHLVVLIANWITIIYFTERLIPEYTAKKCKWPNASDDGSDFNIMLVADPQLIDNHTYANRNGFLLRLTQHTTNKYLYKNFKSLKKILNPKSVLFMGDYLDNGRLDFQGDYPSSTLENYENEMAKFNMIFRQESKPLKKEKGKVKEKIKEKAKENKEIIMENNAELILNLPGNHDIGWSNGITEQALARFHRNFNETNVKIIRQNHELILLDTLSLSNTEIPEIYNPPRAFMEAINNEEKYLKRILFTHVPLYRPKEDCDKCGALRESQSFPISKGFQYQTVLDNLLSKEILTKIKPDLIFSADDHDYCEYEHDFFDNYKDHKVKEVTIKSMSMAMGIYKPAVQLLSLHKEPNAKGHTFDYTICYLPKPYNEVIIYCLNAALTIIVLIFAVFLKSNNVSFITQRKRPFFYDQLENNGDGSGINNNKSVSSRLLQYLEKDEESKIDDDTINRGSYISNMKSFVKQNRRKTRFNITIFTKQACLLFILVAVIYLSFTKVPNKS
ncbi:hypothetical protein PACTADRAFT_50682 [Pachysolen tannophilus NRRL Y-2460]|uniref:Calcineurin-like phosphoesterase domain-containing protein n=1 Tax=Pachysolen tannophilus NRRL Y-2460 TaxID=669874 RepID=A0A1E4TSU6_PACTA|nr:hypothetical protein PACTADRAFT_50682 [Pachysolen tannophilus NRRL Y-2460]